MTRGEGTGASVAPFWNKILMESLFANTFKKMRERAGISYDFDHGIDNRLIFR